MSRPDLHPERSSGHATFEQARLVWLSLLASIGLLQLNLALMLGGQSPVTGRWPGDAASNVVAVAAAAGGMLALLWAHRQATTSTDASRAFAWYVVGWSLAEGVALAGFALAFQRHTRSLAFPFHLAGAALLVLMRPDRSKFEAAGTSAVSSAGSPIPPAAQHAADGQYACPHCGARTFTRVQKLCMAPASSMTCPRCGAGVSIPWASLVLALPPAVGSTVVKFYGPSPGGLALCAVGLVVMVVGWLRHVPLVTRRVPGD